MSGISNGGGTVIIEPDLSGIDENSLLQAEGGKITGTSAFQTDEKTITQKGTLVADPNSVETGNISRGTSNKSPNYIRTNSANLGIAAVSRFFTTGQEYSTSGAGPVIDTHATIAGPILLQDIDTDQVIVPPIESLGTTGEDEIRYGFFVRPAEAGTGTFSFEERLDGPTGKLLIKIDIELDIQPADVGEILFLEYPQGSATEADTLRWSIFTLPPLLFFGVDLGGGSGFPWIADVVAAWTEYHAPRDVNTGTFRAPDPTVDVPLLPAIVEAPYNLTAGNYQVDWSFGGSGINSVLSDVQGEIRQRNPGESPIGGTLIGTPLKGDSGTSYPLAAVTLNDGEELEITALFFSFRQQLLRGAHKVRALGPASYPYEIETGFWSGPIGPAMIGNLSNGENYDVDVDGLGDLRALTRPGRGNRWAVLVPIQRGEILRLDLLGVETTPGDPNTFVPGLERFESYDYGSSFNFSQDFLSTTVTNVAGTTYKVIYTRTNANNAFSGSVFRPRVESPPIIYNPANAVSAPTIPLAGWDAALSTPALTLVGGDVQDGQIAGAGVTGTAVGNLITKPGRYFAVITYTAENDADQGIFGTVVDYDVANATNAIGSFTGSAGYSVFDGLLLQDGANQPIPGGVPPLSPFQVTRGTQIALCAVLDDDGLRVWAGRVNGRIIEWLGVADPVTEEVYTWRQEGAENFRFAFSKPGDPGAFLGGFFQVWEQTSETKLQTPLGFEDINQILS